MVDSSAMSTLGLWDLAPGEAISQSLPVRALHGALAQRCPAPTLDTDEFIAQNGFSEDCSPVDSLKEYALAPGEVRSQSPFRPFQGLQPQRCPPPTLDSEEFDNSIESQDVWIVEDSQAGSELVSGECRLQVPASDMPDARDRFCPPSLDTHEIGNNRVIADNVLFVEDSQAPWDSARGEARQDGSGRHLNDFKSQCFPSLVNVPVPPSNSAPVNSIIDVGVRRKIGSYLARVLSPSAGKRGLSHCSAKGDNEKSKKEAKLDPGANFFDEHDSLHLPVSPTGRSKGGEDDGKVSILRATDSSREQNLGVAERANCGLVALSPRTHTIPTPVPPSIADKVENGFRKTSPGRRFAPTDVTTSKVADARSPNALNSSTKTRGAPTKELDDSCRNLCSDGVFSTSRDNISGNHEILSSPVRHLDKNGVLPATDEVGYRMKSTEVDAPSHGKKAGRGAQAKPKVQSSLGFQAKTPRKVQNDFERDPEEWLCPKAGKRFRQRPKQLSMDHYIS